MFAAARSFAEAAMADLPWIGGVTLAVFSYLLYALLVPERF
jgi:hypothetical protein